MAESLKKVLKDAEIPIQRDNSLPVGHRGVRPFQELFTVVEDAYDVIRDREAAAVKEARDSGARENGTLELLVKANERIRVLENENRSLKMKVAVESVSLGEEDRQELLQVASA